MRFAQALLIGLALGVVAPAMAASPVEGKDYVRMNPPQPTPDPQKIVVTEFFSYQCPHCYAFSRPFAAWTRTLPADVVVERVPVALGRPAWEPVARAYLALSAMKVIGKVDDGIFDAIHRQGMRLDNEQALAQWVATQGIDANAFLAAYRSFGVDTQLKSADLRSRAHQVPGIPAIVIDGRYLVAIEDRGAGFQAQLAMVGDLIAAARKERAARH